MKWFLKIVRDARKAENAKRLIKRLEKYHNRNTPERIKKKGGEWGDGQIEICVNGNETYRAKINKLIVPTSLEEIAVNTADGLKIILELDWCARKRAVEKYIGCETLVATWRWELLQTNTLTFTIRTFYQNKTYRERDVLFPKRLFFTTSAKEHGHFMQKGDPENVQLEDGRIVDTALLEKSKA